MKTIIIKTELEQFQEQYPELYNEIYSMGYMEGQMNPDLKLDEDNNPYYYEDPANAIPTDDSERFCKFGSFNEIYSKAEALEKEEYKSGNRNWRMFLNGYKDFAGKMLYIAWNPTHKLFAVESDWSVINQIYPHLVNAVEQE